MILSSTFQWDIFRISLLEIKELALIFTQIDLFAAWDGRQSLPGRGLSFTCDGQHEGDEEEDEARSGAPGHAGRLHLLSDGGAQGDASNATLASPDSLLADALRTCSFSLSLPGILAMRTPSTLPRRSTTTNRPTRTTTRSLSFPTRGCCGCPPYSPPSASFCRNDWIVRSKLASY